MRYFSEKMAAYVKFDSQPNFRLAGIRFCTHEKKAAAWYWRRSTELWATIRYWAGVPHLQLAHGFRSITESVASMLGFSNDGRWGDHCWKPVVVDACSIQANRADVSAIRLGEDGSEDLPGSRPREKSEKQETVYAAFFLGCFLSAYERVRIAPGLVLHACVQQCLGGT